MNIEIEVNGQKIKAKKGDMILDALRSNGIHVPTLCNMEGFKPSGACRICIVEVEGRQDLIPACSFPVEEWMKISTHSGRVINARRTILELLLSCHAGGCLYCDRNQNCELQGLAVELNVGDHQYTGFSAPGKKDHTSQSILRDPSKCVICGRCVRVCEEVEKVAALDFLRRGGRTEVGTVLDKGLNYTSCVNCGQCILVCPTGALKERTQVDQVVRVLQDPSYYTVALIDPAVLISIGEYFGQKSGYEFTSILATSLKRMGFRKAYSTAWGNEYEMGLAVTEFLERRVGLHEGPALVSTCPSFVKYIEQNRPDLLPNLLQARPGRQILTHLIRMMLSAQTGSPVSKISVIHISACTAVKSEIQSPQKIRQPTWYPDFALTTRELYRLIRLYGIRIDSIHTEARADIFGVPVRSGYLPAISGGYLEGCLRIIAARYPDLAVPSNKIGKLKGLKEIKEFTCELRGQPFTLASLSGLSQFEDWLKEVRQKKRKIDVAEVMVCPHGCINGGGQPLTGPDRNLRARMKGLMEMDDLYSGVEVRQSLDIPFEYQLDTNELKTDFTERYIIR
ncbi:MAG: [Fe-Fe] hydrogenase large subunit C-terminal domain-containing protein [Bacteroidota bacterium]